MQHRIKLYNLKFTKEVKLTLPLCYLYLNTSINGWQNYNSFSTQTKLFMRFFLSFLIESLQLFVYIQFNF